MNNSIENKENAHLTNNSINNYINILKAYAEGKKLQFRIKGTTIWYSAETPSFDFSTNEYRIKPIIYYRPYTSGEEAFNKMQEHSPLGWLYNTITMCYENVICIASNGISTCKENYSYEEALNIFVYPNESKFGVKLDEED